MFASTSRQTVHAAGWIAAVIPITGRLATTLAALEHAAPLVVGDHLIEQPLLGAPVVQVVRPHVLAERLLCERARLPEVDRLAQGGRESLGLGLLVRVPLQLRAGVGLGRDAVQAGGE